MNKYTTLKRSQIVIAIYEHDRELLATNERGQPRIKAGSARDCTLRGERAKLLDALQIKDRELLDKWDKTGFPA